MRKRQVNEEEHVLEEILVTNHQALCWTSSDIEKTSIPSTSVVSDNNEQVPPLGFSSASQGECQGNSSK
jgi:hypothetical protein